MSKIFNHALNKDILSLKTFTGSKKDAAYKQLKTSVMQKHNISRSTLYHELSKNIPGSYKPYDSKGRAIPVGVKEAVMVKDLLSKSASGEEIRKTMSMELGFSYTLRRLNSVKKFISMGNLPESALNENVSGNAADGLRSVDAYSSQYITGQHEQNKKNGQGNISKLLPSTTAGFPAFVIKKSPDEVSKTPTPGTAVEFKGNLRKLFYRLSNISKSEPGKPIKLKLEGTEYNVNPRIVMRCLDQIACSASSGGMDTGEIIRFNLETILLNHSGGYKNGLYMSPSDIKNLESARRSLAALSAPGSGNTLTGGYTLIDVLDAVNHFSPGVKREELINYIKMKNSGDCQM